MTDEVIAKLAQVFADAVEQISALMKHMKSILESVSWKHYRCKICGREHFTHAEAQTCAARHRRALPRGNRAAHIQYSSGRITPRNREVTMRSMEVRRHKHERKRG